VPAEARVVVLTTARAVESSTNAWVRVSAESRTVRRPRESNCPPSRVTRTCCAVPVHSTRKANGGPRDQSGIGEGVTGQAPDQDGDQAVGHERRRCREAQGVAGGYARSLQEADRVLEYGIAHPSQGLVDHQPALAVQGDLHRVGGLAREDRFQDQGSGRADGPLRDPAQLGDLDRDHLEARLGAVARIAGMAPGTAQRVANRSGLQGLVAGIRPCGPRNRQRQLPTPDACRELIEIGQVQGLEVPGSRTDGSAQGEGGLSRGSQGNSHATRVFRHRGRREPGAVEEAQGCWLRSTWPQGMSRRWASPPGRPRARTRRARSWRYP
jgi:hypothetical protein